MSTPSHMWCSDCHSTISDSCNEPVKSTTESSAMLSGISYEIIIATVRIAPRSA